MTDDPARAENYAADRCVDCGELTTNRIHHEERLSAYHDANVSLAPARPSGLLREALALLLDDAFAAEREGDPTFALGIRHAVRVIEDRALAADEPGLDVERLAEEIAALVDAGYGVREAVIGCYGAARLSGREPNGADHDR